MQRTWLAPAPGKGLAVESEVVSHWRATQAQGRRVAVGRRLLSSDGPMVLVVTFADDMAALDELRRRNLSDAEFLAHGAKVASLLREPPRTYVFENVLAAPRAPNTAIGIAAIAFPAPGKERQIVSILEEFTRGSQAAGVAVGLWRRVFSSDGPGVMLSTRYTDLAEFDRVRKERAQITREAAMAVSELSRAPIAQRVTETILPLSA